MAPDEPIGVTADVLRQARMGELSPDVEVSGGETASRWMPVVGDDTCRMPIGDLVDVADGGDSPTLRSLFGSGVGETVEVTYRPREPGHPTKRGEARRSLEEQNVRKR